MRLIFFTLLTTVTIFASGIVNSTTNVRENFINFTNSVDTKIEPLKGNNDLKLSFGDNKIRSLSIEIKDLKTVDSKFIEAKQLDFIDQNRLKAKEYVKHKSIDILDNIIFSADRGFKDKVGNKIVEDRYNLNVVDKFSRGGVDVINKLQDSKINIGIVRGDILGIYNNNLYGFEQFQNYGILCSTSSSLLYLVSKKEIKSIYDLRGKRVSTGVISNIAQIYLNDILKNSGIASDINFRSYDIDRSLKLLEKDKIDVIFIFGSIDYRPKIIKDGFTISSLPIDALQFFDKKKGLISYSYKIKNRNIDTFKVPNYLIAPVDTLDINIATKIEAMVDKFKCYKKIQNINIFYGQIHPEVKNAIARIRMRDQKEDELMKKLNSIDIELKSKTRIDNSTQYIYDVINNSNFDINITFDSYRTKLFDKTAIKPRHVLDNFPKGVIKVKAKTDRLITFVYKNNFTTKVKDTNISLVFKDLTNRDNFITTILNIRDN